MAVDINWGMLTNASQNFGNALVGAAGQVRQHRDTAAQANYLQNPNDPAAFANAVQHNPGEALQIQEHHLEAARALRTDQQQQLDMIGQLLTDPHGQPITDPAQYAQALRVAHQAGIDVTGHETFDPAFVNSVVQLHQRLHPVAPVSVAEGGKLVNPQTGADVAVGNPRPPRYYPLQPGGRLELDPSYQGPTTGGPAPSPPVASSTDIIATNPNGGPPLRLNPQTNQWEPLAAGGAGPGQPGFRQDADAFNFRVNPTPGG